MKVSRFLLFQLFLLSIFSRASASVMILNGLTHVHTGIGGNTISGIIKMRNEGKKGSRVVIYQQDLALSCDSPLDYKDLDASSDSRSLGKWLKTNVDEKTLEPNEDYEVSYTINVPLNVKEDGTYWTIIMIEVAEPLREKSSTGVNIDSKVRYAIQIITDVGLIKSPKLTFEKVEFKNTKPSEPKIIQIKLKNDGAFLARTNLNIEIFNSVGEKIKVIKGVLKKVYPGYCNDFEIELIDLPKGKFEGILVADNGKDLFGENLTIEIE